jgi:plastocyanin
MKKARYLLLLGVLIGFQSFAQTIINISDADIAPGQTVNWTKNNIYLLDGLVFVESGSTLNIEAGTVVKFTDNATVGNPSALVICRDGKIFAEGTANEPIIFTAQADDTNNPTDLGPKDNALWGGIVMLGNAVTQKNGNSEVNVEGIPTTEPRGLYGGNDNTDNSGVLKYVSIRHGGRQLTSGNELNGLTLGAVGSGTTLDYIEVYANSDDGIEFFGGAPNLKHAVVAFAEDDSFDWDEVYTGKGQFWFSIQREDVADLGGELDGTTPDDATPYANPTVYNWTHIGSGPGATAANPLGWLFRAGTAGTVANSIVAAQKNKVLEVQDKAAPTNDAYTKLQNGELRLLSNLFFGSGSGQTIDNNGIIRVSSGSPDDATASFLANHLVTNINQISDPGIQSISRDQDNLLDPRPTGNTAVQTGLATLPAGDPFFTNVNYKGAFSPFAGSMWLRGWTTLERNNHLKPLSNEVVLINDNSINPCETVTWTSDKTYIVDGLTFVEDCATLIIEAGTVVKFTDKAEVGNPSALVIARGGKIFAEGTADEPIIFTAEADDVNDPNDLGPKDNALWGGIVLLGKGVTQKNGNSEVNVEGIPTTEPRGLYGGADNTDNSGVMKYVSIRHGGRQLTSGNELNGLTLGAIGSGTTLDYIEVYANSDDGIEFFGGAPNLKHAVVAFAEDDSYDWDEVFTGKGQFWFSIQREDVADLGGELDGTTPDDASPYSNPMVYNWTHIGSGPGATAANPLGWLFRAGTAGTVANSIVAAQKNKVLEVQDKAAPTNDAYTKLQNGELRLLSNLFFGSGSGQTIDNNGIIRVTSGSPDDATAAFLANHLVTNTNQISDPGIVSISRDQDNLLDPRPTGNTAVQSGLAALPAGDPFFTNVNYKGAFSPFAGSLWLRGWTTLERNNHLKPLSNEVVLINDNSINPCETVTWTKDKTYIVDGLTFVEDCATLNIEAGTVVKFTDKAEVGNPSALVIARGGKIFASGTAAEPIIFTAEADDVNDPNDLGPKDNALWGGIVLLGKGVTQKNGNSEVNVEGIPTTEPRGLYGGNDNTDNSGALQYVSIRHGGRQLTSGNELNGLTLGAVGSGTILDYVEVYANSDDGIEFFGGAPNLKHAIVAFAEDDSYDWDEVYTGQGQFWFSIQREDVADLGGELDGTTPDDATPYANPTVYNWTHIGSGPGATAANPLGWLFRAGTAGTVANSIVAAQKNKVLEVQDKAAPANDAYTKLQNGELKILSNLFWGSGSAQTIDNSGIIRVTSGSPDDATATFLTNHLVNNNNEIADPKIVSISRDQNNLLDPRVTGGAAAFTTPFAAYPSNPFFTTVDYKGAFSNCWSDLWIRDWSTLAKNGHLVNTPNIDCSVGTEDLDNSLVSIFRIFPNPARGTFIVESQFDSEVGIEIFDMAGRMVSQINSIPTGQHVIEINALVPGMYAIKFRTADGKVITKKLIVE